MANPITAIASRSCAKNSMLKQTKEDEKDLSKGSETKSVSTTADVAQDIGGGRAIYGSQTDTTITSPGSEGTSGTKLPSYKEAWEQDLEGIKGKYASYEDYVKDMQGIKPGDTRDVEREAARAEAAKGTPGTPGEEKKDSEFKIDQEQVKGMENLDLRQEIRSEKALNRLDRQAERRQHRFERKGLTGEAKREARAKQKVKKRASNIQRQQDIQNLIAQRKAQRDLQRDQSSFGGENYYTGKVRADEAGMSAMSGMGDVKFAPNTDVAPTFSGKTPAGNLLQNATNLVKPLGNIIDDVLSGSKKTGPLKKNYFNK